MTRAHRVLAGLLVIGGVGALAAGEPRSHAIDATALAREIEQGADHVSALELGRWIAAGEEVLVFDLRSAPAYDSLHIPTATRITLDELQRLDLPRTTRIVLSSEGGAHAAQAWVLLRARGYTDVRFLREGLYEWVSRVLEPRLAIDATPAESADYAVAAPLSRHFGGQPRRNVPRSEVPAGYWTDSATGVSGRDDVVGRVRRRGC